MSASFAASLETGLATPRAEAPRPYTLVAELTHRCPLGCPYCSNPLELTRRSDELPTETWREVLDDAAALGVVQAHFTGGEPLLHPGLEELIAHAESRDLYTHLVTSGLPNGAARLEALARAGLSAVQLSFQSSDRDEADFLAGTAAHDLKLAFAEAARKVGLPLTVNVVLHARNIGRTKEIVALAESLGADRLELANAQYLGFALENRAALLPTREEMELAALVASEEKARLSGRMELVFVLPDYLRGVPRACMDGWARRFIHVAPDGTVLPCHAAMTLPDMRFETVRERRLRDQWETPPERPEGAPLPGLQRFRGTSWMREPCRDCERREVDFGGCRCQAYALTGDASATDPACRLSPAHKLVTEAPRDRDKRFLFRGRAPTSVAPKGPQK